MKKNQTIRFIINGAEIQQLRLDKKDQLLELITQAIRKLGPVKKVTITALGGEE